MGNVVHRLKTYSCPGREGRRKKAIFRLITKEHSQFSCLATFRPRRARLRRLYSTRCMLGTAIRQTGYVGVSCRNSRGKFRSGPGFARATAFHDDRRGTLRSPLGMRNRLLEQLRTQTENLRLSPVCALAEACAAHGPSFLFSPLRKLEVGPGARRSWSRLRQLRHACTVPRVREGGKFALGAATVPFGQLALDRLQTQGLFGE